MIPVSYLFELNYHSTKDKEAYKDPRVPLNTKSDMLSNKSDQLFNFANNPGTPQKLKMKFLRGSSALKGAAANVLAQHNRQEASISAKQKPNRVTSRVSYPSVRKLTHNRPNVPKIKKRAA